MSSICVALIDDHAIFRIGLGMVIGTAMPGTRIFEAASLDEALAGAPDHVDVVLLDIRLNGLSGLEGIGLLKHKWPMTPVLMLSSHDEPETVRLALARGAAGFVSKAQAAAQIVEAILLVLRGSVGGLPSIASRAAPRRLTPRQCEVLELLHQGLSNKLIARQLTVSDNTVRRHVQDILEFFGVASRTEAVFAARCQALVG
ncbi:response regulator transcription factor [Rhodoferax ferrireducens]|uniref:response regulator transcription factor n=1 Tax=Rhodoferax ferrireducens TaxID=192843 RepID=UPI000E0D2079|nr:response regulator transcription factor [Rhodoferax ferrireducens]